MKTKTKTPANPTAPAMPDAESLNGKKDRLQVSFDMDESGKPDYSSMRDKTRARLRDLFTDPKFREEIGAAAMAPGPVIPKIEMFSPMMVGGLYDVMGGIQTMLIPAIFKQVPPAIAKQIFTYTDQEKALLVPPTIRVLDKYAAAWMIKYQDEIALAGLLVTLTIQKVQAAIMLSRASQAQTPETPKKEGEGTEPKPN